MVVINKNDLDRFVAPKTSIQQSNTEINKFSSQVSEVNKILTNLQTLIDKAKDFKQFSNQNSQQTQQFNPAIAQETKTHFPKLIVDETKATELLNNLIKNIPESFDKLTIKEIKEQIDNFKDIHKSQITNFIKSCVRLE